MPYQVNMFLRARLMNNLLIRATTKDRNLRVMGEHSSIETVIQNVIYAVLHTPSGNAVMQFKKMNIAGRWNLAKISGLSCRCLVHGHMGTNCSWSRHCGIDGCGKTHNRLLHRDVNNESKSKRMDEERTEVHLRNEKSSAHEIQAHSPMKGKETT